MVSKRVGAALLVLAGVGTVIVADKVIGSKEIRPDRRLEIKNIEVEQGPVIFKFLETIKLKTDGLEIGKAVLYMQTKSLLEGDTVDLQIQEVDISQKTKGSDFDILWENFAIGEGAVVEFFIFDQNNSALAEELRITVDG